jgi:alpha-ketoglutaric semialdehyde dehydrogenase
MTYVQKAAKDIFVVDKVSKKTFVKGFIGGTWQQGAGKLSSVVVNPAFNRTLYWVRDASSKQIDDAFVFARTAQEFWHHDVSQAEKEKIFQAVASLVLQHRGTFVKIQIEEAGRLWKFADAEVQGMLNSIWHYHGEISRVDGVFSRSQMKDKFSITVREPYGVILGITPWNSVLVLPARKIFAALAGGNAIVMKDDEKTPAALSLFVWLFQQTLIDVLGEEKAAKAANVLQLVHGQGSSVGSYLVEKADYDKVMFTGSPATGAIIARAAGARLKPSSLELGGHGAIILMDDFDIDRAVSETLAAGFGDGGQRCVALRAVFVHKKSYADFLKKLTVKAKAYNVGDPSLESIDMGPIVNKESLKNIDIAIKASVKQGASIQAGGKVDSKNGNYCQPTILTGVTLESPTMKEEVFGPIISVIPFDGETHEKAMLSALDMVNASKYGLSNSILTHNIPLAMRCLERIQTGVFYIGRGTTGAEEGKPFGGIKDSGFGREAGGLDEVTYLKQIYVDSHGKTRIANMGDVQATLKRIRESESLF